MALRLGALYDALVETGLSKESAGKAAEEVAAYDNRIEKLDGKVTLLTWMVGVNLALEIAIFLRLFLG